MDWLDDLRPKPLLSLRWKLLTYFLVFSLIFVLVGVYANLGTKLSTTLLEAILLENRRLEDVSSRLSALRYHGDKYLADGSISSLEAYFASAAALGESVDSLWDLALEAAVINKRMIHLDLINSINSVFDVSCKAVDARRNNWQNQAYRLGQRMDEAVESIQRQIVLLMNQNTVEGTRAYESAAVKTRRIEVTSYLLAAAIAMLGIVFTIQFTYGITQPLYQIIGNAKAMAQGQFRVGPVHVDTNDELQIIANVFNHMTHSVAELFERREEKILLERQLKEEKLRNLQMSSLLREAELKALQAQVNPHFLYNTLNAISQVAILEGADETSELTKTVASLFRYNLRGLDQPVTIRDEINNVQQYLKIMKVRFGDQLDFEIKVEDSIQDYLIPCMTLQPIVENAIIHGLSKVERLGRISILGQAQGKKLIIRIADNGVGMDEEQVRRLVQPDEAAGEPVFEGHTTGLGLHNITCRLRFFYDCSDVIQIYSQPEKGTVVQLSLPLRKEGSMCTVS